MAQTNTDFPEQIKRFSHGLDSLNPFQIYHGIGKGKKQHFSGDAHLDPQIFIVLSGEVDFYLDNVMHHGCAGDVFISNFWEPHAVRQTSEESDFAVITFSLFAAGKNTPFNDFDWLLFMKQPPALRKISFEGEDKENILVLAQKIIRLHTRQQTGYRSMIWFAIHEILYHINLKYLSESPVRKRTKPDIKLFPALELLRLNPDREIPLDEAAAACCMSRSAFCSAFKSVMNESFSSFAMKKRIAYACMLLSRSHPIKEVSDMCGFTNITHFYHTFKKIQNCTPVEFISGGKFTAGTSDQNI